MAWVALLGERPVVELAGPDARRFANGMFTNNVRDLPVGGSQASAMADDRGRLIGLMELHAVADDRLLLVLEGMTAEAFVERYERYVVFDDVEIIDHGPHALVTVQGEGAAQRLAEASLPVPAAGPHLAHGAGWVVSRDRGGAGFDLLAPTPLLVPDAEGAAEVEALRVRAGRVAFPRDIAPPALPHEHGLRDTVLHFEKGCYLGQEQIHRIEVMGKPRRALALFHLIEGGGGRRRGGARRQEGGPHHQRGPPSRHRAHRPGGGAQAGPRAGRGGARRRAPGGGPASSPCALRGPTGCGAPRSGCARRGSRGHRPSTRWRRRCGRGWATTR